MAQDTGFEYADEGPYATSPPLLEKLSDHEDEEAWARFYDCYAPLIVGFARWKGCTPEDANDVLQEVMAAFLKQMPQFRYKPSLGKFRSFLLAITASKVIDAQRRRAKQLALMQNQAVQDQDAVARAPVPMTEEEWEQLCQERILLEALARVEERVKGTTFDSFRLVYLEEWPVAEVEKRLGLSANVIYQNRHRVLVMLREEFECVKREQGELP